MLVVQLDRTRHVGEWLQVIDRIIRLTGAGEQQGNCIPELLAAIKGAVRHPSEAEVVTLSGNL